MIIVVIAFVMKIVGLHEGMYTRSLFFTFGESWVV